MQVVYCIVCIGAVLIFAILAMYKNRSVILWALLGPLVPLAFPILLMLPKLCANCRKPLSKWDAKHSTKCPHCGQNTDPIEAPEEGLSQHEEPKVQRPAVALPSGDIEQTESEPTADSDEETHPNWAVAERDQLPAAALPSADIAEVESALASDDELDRNWALAELDRLPAEQAQTIRQKNKQRKPNENLNLT